MSTSFYKIVEPFTAISVKKNDTYPHTHVDANFFISGKSVGFLRLHKDQIVSFLTLFIGDKVAERTGTGAGKVKLQFFDVEAVAGGAKLLSEYCQIGYFHDNEFVVQFDPKAATEE